MYMDRSSGNVSIGYPAQTALGNRLEVSGNINCTGKITSGGGYDPPYVAFTMESRQAIIERVEREIPEGRRSEKSM